MPLEALGELTAYQVFVVELARRLFLAAHPDRRRAPRGFADRLQLRISRIEEGSAVPILERVESEITLAFADEFTAARDLITEVVAGGGEPDLPEAFPDEMLGYFDGFGRTLREDETLELCAPGSDRGPVYSPAIRQKLVVRRPSTILQDILLVGQVVELDADRETMRFRMEGRDPIPARFERHQFEAARAVLAPAETARVVQVDAIAEIGRGGKPTRIETIRSIQPVENAEFARVAVRLSELESLGPGWMNGQGGAPAAAAVRATRDLLRTLEIEDINPPRLYPTLSRGLQLEWQSERWETVMIVCEDGSGSASFLDLSNQDEEEFATIDDTVLELLKERV